LLAVGGWFGLRGSSERFVVVECPMAQGTCRVLEQVKTERALLRPFGVFTMTTEVLAEGDLTSLTAQVTARYAEFAGVDLDACLTEAAAVFALQPGSRSKQGEALQCKMKVDI
jgi:hypothetical protein